VVAVTDLAWQPSLLDAVELGLGHPRRHELAGGAWVDVEPGWCGSADTERPAEARSSTADDLFARLLDETPWGPQRSVRMYERLVPEPRLTHR